MTTPSRRPVITLLTDYGITDEFVGVLHGVIARICPDARVIDLTHGIASHDIRGGAAVLAQSLPYMPVGVHVAIVDPTVGGDRPAVALRLGDGRVLIGPDNGLLWLAAEAGGGVEQAVDISRSRWRLEPISATFHGRDIFAPVAAHLAEGEPFDQAGDPLDPSLLVEVEMWRARTEGGALVAIVNNTDRFGNVQLAATPEDLYGLGLQPGARVRVRAESGEFHIGTYGRTFSDVDEGQLLVFEDSARKLAVAFNRGSAVARLGLRPGDELRLTIARDQ